MFETIAFRREIIFVNIVARLESYNRTIVYKHTYINISRVIVKFELIIENVECVIFIFTFSKHTKRNFSFAIVYTPFSREDRFGRIFEYDFEKFERDSRSVNIFSPAMGI